MDSYIRSLNTTKISICLKRNQSSLKVRDDFLVKKLTK